MKRLIALRKQHKVLGRGSLTLVPCSNRKVLAFLRSDDHETVLVVVNLSRTVQPVELDLSGLAGQYPIEMIGLAEFPRVSERPYFLTLGPHGSYLFQMQATPLMVTHLAPWSALDRPETPVNSLTALMVGVDWDGILDRSTRHVLERQALAAFLMRQRWFGGKSRQLRDVRFSDWVTLRNGQTPAFLALATATFADGGTDTYCLPLATLAGDRAARVLAETPGIVLAQITGARKGVVVDGFQDDDTCARILAWVGSAERVTTAHGFVAGRVERPPLALTAEPKWVRGGGDQSNSIAFADERFALKLYRRLEPGTNPEVEIGQVLTRRGFERTPTLHGALTYERPSGEPATLALVQSAVTHQGSAWTFTIDELRRYYERVAARGAELPAMPSAADLDAAPPPFFTTVEGWYLDTASLLGRRTAELHLALADPTDPEFAPEPLDGSRLPALAAALHDHGERMLALLEAQRSTLPETAWPAVDAVLADRASLLARFDRVATLTDAGCRIRIHGDYHLGQVLRTEEDFVILDFEGEPARSLAERREKQTPIKDVAGMIRSFGYAAYAALYASTAAGTPTGTTALEAWADLWQSWVSRRFVDEYRAVVRGSGLIPESSDALDVLLGAWTLDKALYELGYELNNRPEWVRIPLAGILQLRHV
ncbi:MAG: putative maltokinase, partial [Vicinamibacterales bacterium]